LVPPLEREVMNELGPAALVRGVCKPKLLVFC
jgi:hypothetical protein